MPALDAETPNVIEPGDSAEPASAPELDDTESDAGTEAPDTNPSEPADREAKSDTTEAIDMANINAESTEWTKAASEELCGSLGEPASTPKGAKRVPAQVALCFSPCLGAAHQPDDTRTGHQRGSCVQTQQHR